MANRTISLSPMGDLIRKKMMKDGIVFSNWIETHLLQWNMDQKGIESEVKVELPPVPLHYSCQKCMKQGVHWTSECDVNFGDDL